MPRCGGWFGERDPATTSRHKQYEHRSRGWVGGIGVHAYAYVVHVTSRNNPHRGVGSFFQGASSLVKFVFARRIPAAASSEGPLAWCAGRLWCSDSAIICRAKLWNCSLKVDGRLTLLQSPGATIPFNVDQMRRPSVLPSVIEDEKCDGRMLSVC